MTDLRTRLTESLRRQADPVSAGPGLARAAQRQALRLRLKRRIATGVTCAVALAVAVPVGYNLLGSGVQRIVPAESVTALPTLTALPTRLSTVSIDLERLSKGEPPDIPWYADGAIHDGDRTVPVEGAASAPVQFHPVANGYVVQVGQQVSLLNAKGEQVADLTRYGRFPSVSSDGRRLATTAGRRATILDATTGKVVLQLDAEAPLGVVGFVEGSVLLGGTVTPQPAWLWNPESGKVTPFRIGGLGKLNGRTDGRNRLVVASASGSCYDVFDLRTKRRLWQLCGAVNPEFTADGRFLVAEKEGTGPLVMDAATGRKLLQVSGLRLMYMPAPSEPAGTMLFLALGKSASSPDVLLRGASVVRCTLTGQCTLAVEGDPDRETALPDPSWLFF